MTRKSRRELERAIEKLARVDTPGEWVSEYIKRAEFSAAFVGEGSDRQPREESDREGVKIRAGNDFRHGFRAPEEYIPEWIDVNEDLPVRD